MQIPAVVSVSQPENAKNRELLVKILEKSSIEQFEWCQKVWSASEEKLAQGRISFDLF